MTSTVNTDTVQFNSQLGGSRRQPQQLENKVGRAEYQNAGSRYRKSHITEYTEEETQNRYHTSLKLARQQINHIKGVATDLDKKIVYDSTNLQRAASENKKKFMDNYAINLEIPSEYV